jgi:hypothetical protein
MEKAIQQPAEITPMFPLKKKRRLFKNPALQERFDRDGYVVIDFLNPVEVDVLNLAYASLQGDLGQPAFASTIMSHDAGYRLEVSALIENIFERAVQETLQDARFFWGNFNIKYPNGNLGIVPLHQDPSFLDERYFYALGLWVPLTDITPENGALQVIPGSHNILNQPRCGGRPFPYGTWQQELLQQFGKQLLMRAGQAYIGSPALFHASPPNTSSKPRIVAAGLAGPAESALRYFNYRQCDGGGVAEMFEVDHDYYVTAPLFSRPDTDRYHILETVQLDEPEPAIAQLIEMLTNFTTR